ncbi:MAG: hypothetical protein ACI9TH_001128 [Kiritimatiellia bacterium]|jgi:hypothetical protein
MPIHIRLTDRYLLILIFCLSGIHFTFAGGIGGRVANTLGSPAPFEEVELYDSGGSFVDFATTDVNGAYLFANLTADTYYVRTLVFANLIDEWFDDVTATGFDPFADSADPILITGSTTNLMVDFALNPGGSITGRVADAGSQPVSNVLMRAVNTSNGASYEATTDAAGQYVIHQLPGGPYFVRTLNTIGLVDEWYNDHIVITGDGIADAANTINLFPGGLAANIDFQLALGGAVSGSVTDQLGEPVTGLTVRVTLDDGSEIGSGTTSATGAYLVNSLPDGSYYVRTAVSTQLLVDEWFNDIEVTSGDPLADAANAISVLAGFLTPGVDFALDPSGSISGTLFDPNAAALPNATVELRTVSGFFLKSTDTDASGTFRFAGLADGSYSLRSAVDLPAYAEVWYEQTPLLTGLPTTDGATLITIASANQISGADLTLLQAGRISGQVTQPFPGGAVTSGEIAAYTADGLLVRVVNLDGSGNYLMTSLPPATYTIRSYNTGLLDEWYDDLLATGDDPVVDHADTLVLTGGAALTGIDLELESGGTINGEVRDENSQPITNATVIATFANGLIAGTTTTSASGTYTLDVLPVGTLYVRTSNGSGFIDEWFDDVIRTSNDPIVNGATGIMVAGGLIGPSVDFKLALGGTLGGRVSTAGNQPLAGIDIDVYDASGNFVRGSTTAADGSYTVIALPGGDYFVNTFDATQIYLDEWFDDILFTSLNPNVDQPDPVNVVLGSHTGNIDFGLEPPGSLSGVIFDTETNLIEQVPIELRRPDGSLVGTVVGDDTGFFAFSRIPAGSYHLRSGVYDKHPLRDAWLGGALVIANNPTAEGSVAVNILAGGSISNADLMLPVLPGLRFEVVSGTGFLDLTVLAGDTYRIMRTDDLLGPFPWTDAPNGSGPGEASLFTTSTNGLVTYLDPTVAQTPIGFYGYERMFSFFDDMENGTNGWTVSHGSGLALDWLQSTQQASSGSTSWFATNTVGTSELHLISPEQPLDADPGLAFWHWFDTERGFDGGRVEISTAGPGGPWSDLGSAMTLNGYNFPSMGSSSVFAGGPAFSGNSGGFLRTEIDLSAFAGQTVHIRFRMASDNVFKVSGWFIDDVQIR